MKVRKIPVEVEAVQYDGSEKSILEIFALRNSNSTAVIRSVDGGMRIRTLEGEMRVSKGDFVIRGIKGELYPCKPDIFEKTYEIIPEGE